MALKGDICERLDWRGASGFERFMRVVVFGAPGVFLAVIFCCMPFGEGHVSIVYTPLCIALFALLVWLSGRMPALGAT